MAEVQAGQTDAPKKDDHPQDDAPADAPKYSQAEMDRITAKVRKNAARDAELRFRREQGSRQEPPPQDRRQEEPTKEDLEPKREDFESFEDHQRALTAFDSRKATREELAKAKQEEKAKAERESQEKAARTWAGKIGQAQAKHADFDDVLEENDATLEVIANAPMRGFITESDIGPQIVYELCKTPAEAKRIAALPGYKQAAEIAKIEERLTAKPKPKEGEGDDEPKDEDKTGDDAPTVERDDEGRFKPKKEAPKVDDPIEPVGARPANASAEPSDRDDTATWHRKRVAQLARRRNPGK